MNVSEKLGTRIRKYREKLGLSVEDLAKNAGIDQALITNIEEGNTYPGISVMVKLSRSLGQRLGTFTDDQFREDPVIVRQGTITICSERERRTATWSLSSYG